MKILATRVLFLCLLICFTHPNIWANERIGVMTFNVENLFDTVHQPTDGNDATYRPLRWKKAHRQEQKKNCAPLLDLDVAPGLKAHWHRLCLNMDWSEKHLDIKVQRLAATVLQVKHGRGPDILFLQEVENLEVIERFRKHYLQAAGYQPAILIEGDDARGIDVAILTRLPLVEKPQLHAPTAFSRATRAQRDDTRRILETTVQTPDGEWLTLFALHMPAHHLPRLMREEQIAHLLQLVQALPADRRVLAAGDFNINRKEDQKYKMYQKLTSQFHLSHQLKKLQGSYYYQGWSTLDAILVNKGLVGQVVIDSIRVLKGNPDQIRANGTPKRFSLPRKPDQQVRGVSDHLPVYLELTVGAKLARRQLKLRPGFQLEKWNKVAFFDADSTLRVSRSGSPSANTPQDVRLLPLVAEKIKQLNRDGYLVAILSNQAGVPYFVSYATADAALRYTIQLLKQQGAYVDYYDFAEFKDRDRKGGIGMAERLERKLRAIHPQAQISKWNSLMVGDAAYKKNKETRPDGTAGYNFSNSDRLFAQNYGISFYEPRDYFGYSDYDPSFTFFSSLQQVEEFEDKYLK